MKLNEKKKGGESGMRVLLTTLLISLILLGAAVAAQDAKLEYVKPYGDGTHQITLNGEVLWAVPVPRARQLREAEKLLPSTEADLKACSGVLLKTQDDLQTAKDSEQLMKVARGRIEADYAAQSTVLSSCMELSKNGPKALRDWRVQLAFDAAPTITNFLRRCN